MGNAVDFELRGHRHDRFFVFGRRRNVLQIVSQAIYVFGSRICLHGRLLSRTSVLHAKNKLVGVVRSPIDGIRHSDSRTRSQGRRRQTMAESGIYSVSALGNLDAGRPFVLGRSSVRFQTGRLAVFLETVFILGADVGFPYFLPAQ